jgi:hypothetical protein
MSMPTASSQTDDTSIEGPGPALLRNDPAALRCDAGLWRAVAESRRVDVYVWGAGQAGQSVASAIRTRGGAIAGFIETSGHRAGAWLDGAPVAGPCIIEGRRGTSAPFVVIASSFSAAIVDTLRAMAWPADSFMVIDAGPLFVPQPAVPTSNPAAAGPLPLPLTNSLGQSIARARRLDAQHVRNCRVLPGRDVVLSLLPRGGVVAEIGTQHGRFARAILSAVRPAVMHIVDIDMSLLERGPLEAARAGAIVHLHEGDSASYLDSLPEHTFDWVYIDGDHSLNGVRRDAMAALRTIKADGLLLFNDYTTYSPLELFQYGVAQVVHDLCLDHGFEMIYLALHGMGYHDVVLRRRQVTGTPLALP